MEQSAPAANASPLNDALSGGFPFNNDAAKRQYAKLDAETRAAAIDATLDTSAFASLHAALSKAGPLSIDRLMKVAEEYKIKASRAEVADIFRGYDKNFDGQIQLKEFAQWWSGASDPLSILLRNALSESTLAPAACSSWSRGHNVRADVTIGDVDDKYEAKSGIYVTAVPASEKCLREAAGISADERKPYLHAKALVICKRAASDDDISQLVDLANMGADLVQDEMSRGSGKLFRVTFKRDAVALVENGPLEKCIEVDFVLLNVPGLQAGSDKDPRVMLDEYMTLAGVKGMPLFRSIVLGIEFATDASEVISPMPPRGLAELANGLRVHANVEYDDTPLKVGSAMLMHSDGGVRERSLPVYAISQFLARGLRNVHVTSSFRSYQEVIDQVLEATSKWPFVVPTGTGADDSAPEFSKEQYLKGETGAADKDDGPRTAHLRALAAGAVRDRIKQIASLANTRCTLLYALPFLRYIWGSVPNYYVVDMLCGDNGQDADASRGLLLGARRAIADALQAAPNSEFFGGLRVNIRHKAADTRFCVVVENDSNAALPNCRGDPTETGGLCTVYFVDYTSSETLATGAYYWQRRGVAMRSLTPKTQDVLFVFTAAPGAAVSYEDAVAKFVEAVGGMPSDYATKCFCKFAVPATPAGATFDAVPEPLRAFIALNEDGSDTPGPDHKSVWSIEDPADVDKEARKALGLGARVSSSMRERELVPLLATTALRTIRGVASVDVTTEVVNVEVNFKNFNVGDVTDNALDLELMRRNRLEFATRLWQMKDPLRGVMDLEELKPDNWSPLSAADEAKDLDKFRKQFASTRSAAPQEEAVAANAVDNDARSTCSSVIDRDDL